MIITKAIPNTATLEDLGSHIYRERLPVKFACNLECDFEPEECESPFAYVVQQGDDLHIQFRFADQFNTDPTDPQFGWDTGVGLFWIAADLMNCDGTVAYADITRQAAIDDGITAGYAVGYQNGSFQNLTLSVSPELVSAVNGDCFYIQVRYCRRIPVRASVVVQGLFESLPPLSGYQVGDNVIADGILYIYSPSGWAVVSPQPQVDDMAWDAVAGLWYMLTSEGWEVSDPVDVEQDCENPRICRTPLYSFTKCFNPVCIEADHVLLDCDGRYYGNEGATQTLGDWEYRERFCFRGELESVGFDPIREISDGGAITSERRVSVYNLKAIMPQHAAKRLSSALIARTFRINGIEFDEYDTIQKNNDDGSDWHIDIELRINDCDLQSDCL
jgi:hypothetical protein